MTPVMELGNATTIDNDEDGVVDIEVWYVDISTDFTFAPTHPSQPFPSWFVKDGDGIAVSGFDHSFEGAVVKVYEGLDLIATTTPIPELPRYRVDIELDAPTVEKRFDDMDLYWDATLAVSVFEPAREMIAWDDVTVVVTVDDGATELVNRTAQADTGTYGDAPLPWFVDDGTSAGYLDVGDSILLTGMGLGFRGANLSVWWDDDRLDFAMMPDTFDVSNLSIVLGGLTTSNRTVSTELVFDVDLTEITYGPENIGIPWDELAISLTDPDTSNVLLEVMTADPWGGTPSDTPAVYYDDDDGDGFVSEGDVLKLSGLTDAFENAKLEIFLDDTRIGSRSLPNNFDPSKWTDVTLNVASPTVNLRDINGTTYWDMILNVNKKTPGGAIVLWSDIRITIVDSLGTTLIDMAIPVADSTVYDEDDTDGINVELWFIETAMNDQCNAGDAFKLTGLTRAFQGGTINIYRFGEVIGSATFPAVFP